MSTLLQDLRYALRMLAKNPGFTAMAVLTLALGIGANTAIFQLLDAVRLRSLPVPNPQELAVVRIVGGHHGFGVNNDPYGELTLPIWQELREHHDPFSGVFAWGAEISNVGRVSDLRRAHGIYVSGEFFPVLRIQPWRGRLLLPEDEGSACPSSKAVVSYSYWQSEMGGGAISPDTSLMVDGQLVQVVGVTPPGFSGVAVGEGFDIATPFCRPKEYRREVFEITVMGRLRSDWTLEQASALLGARSPALFDATAPPGYDSQALETYKRFRLGAYPAAGGVSSLREQYDRSLWLLLGITALVLLLACANLANLMLARASTREREFAVRVAMGASRIRLLRQLLAESALLATLGGLLGISLAQALSRVLVWAISTETNKVTLPMATDWRVLLFALAVAGLTCALFGALPAQRATQVDPGSAMKSGGRSTTTGREGFSLQRSLVVTQISVSLVLLVGALLFVRSFRNLLTFDPGMREAGIITAFIAFQDAHVTPDRHDQFKRQLLDDVRMVPGIQDAAITTNVPLLGSSWTHGVHVGSAEGSSKFTWVSPDYFQTLGIPLIAGRNFNQYDTAASARVSIVNRAFVRQFLGGDNPLGKTLRTDPEPRYPSTVYEIVGVIPDTKYSDVRGETPPMAFAPAPQYPAQAPWTVMMIYSHLPSAAAIAAVKHELAAKHPDIPVEIGDFQGQIRDGMVQERLMAFVTGFFGFLAALLAMVGLYGVIAYTVSRRRNEIGIRMTLGAQRQQVVRMVMLDAAGLCAIGIIIGTALSLAFGSGASSLLFGLRPYDPVTLASASGLLAVVAAIASFVPARRATKVDPMVALRYE